LVERFTIDIRFHIEACGFDTPALHFVNELIFEINYDKAAIKNELQSSKTGKSTQISNQDLRNIFRFRMLAYRRA